MSKLKSQGIASIIIILIVAGVLAVSGGYYVYQKFQKAPEMLRQNQKIGQKISKQIDGSETKKETTGEIKELSSSKKIGTLCPNCRFIDTSVVISPDNTRVAYAIDAYADDNIGDHANIYVVLDGKTWGEYPVKGNYIFSPNSKNFAYISAEYPLPDEPSSKQFVVFNGEKQKEYDNVNGIVFSPDSKHLAYTVNNHVNYNRMADFLVIDGQEQKHYDDIGGVTYSSDGKHNAYAALLGGRDGKWFMVIDGKEQKEYKYIQSFSFSADGTHFSYVAGDSMDSLNIIYDGEKIGQGNRPVFNSYGGGFAYRTKISDGKWFYTINGQAQKIYDFVDLPFIFSKNGERFAYHVILYNSDGKEFYIVDGKEQKLIYDSVGNFIFSPNGEHFAYIASTKEGQGSTYIIRDGKELKVLSYIKDILFDSTGDNFAYIIQKYNKQALVVSGKEKKAYDFVGDPIFRPDGKIQYIAKDGNEIWWIIEPVD